MHACSFLSAEQNSRQHGGKGIEILLHACMHACSFLSAEQNSRQHGGKGIDGGMRMNRHPEHSSSVAVGQSHPDHSSPVADGQSQS